ncbi:hypothetical protein QCA50_014107 [Cerrena zonata]|uniref:DUF6534 domain-containing protein n=1 Tax=Cerrena zonata TaxID=2478898 RepID=A0AAW0FT45_9APHY
MKSARGFKPSYTVTNCVILFTDAIIASTMAFYLHRKQGQIRKTRGIITWLILYFVNTGAILVALSLTSLITFFAAPNSLLFCATILLYNRALANALFGALNARLLLRTKQNDIVTFGGTSVSGNTTFPSHHVQKVQVHVERDVMMVGNTSTSEGDTDKALGSTQSLDTIQVKV